MKLIFSTLSLLVSISLFSQDTTYYTKAGTKTLNKDSADFYSVTFKNTTDSNRLVRKKYSMSGQIEREDNYNDYEKRVFKRKVYNADGALLSEINYKQDKMDGKVLTYWNNGKLKRSDVYIQDTLLEGKCFTPDGKDTLYFPYISSPQFIGGIDSLRTFLKKNLHYPRSAMYDGYEGTVYVSFIIDKNGEVTNTSVYKGVSAELNAEALRVVSKMPKWMPGKLDGEYNKFGYTLPLTFISSDE